jgi:hydroxyacylglutathione hydrolase
MQIKWINLGMVNCYLIKTDDAFVLVDTGIPVKRKSLENRLVESGCVPGKLNLVILTHGDIDHSGNCVYFRKKFGVKIGMHRLDSNMVENCDLRQERKVTSVLMKLMQSVMSMTGIYKKMVSDFERFKPDIYLEDGQSLTDFGINGKIIHIPGHTDGSIAVLTEDGDAVTGDTLFNIGGRLSQAMIIGDQKKLDESYARLKSLNIQTVYPGHGKPFRMDELKKR